MIEEINKIRVMFTVICGAKDDDDCPDESRLVPFRTLGARFDDPEELMAKLRKTLVDSLKNNHQAPDGKPSLKDIGHYRVEIRNADGEVIEKESGRDVFTGLVEVPSNVFVRNEDTNLLEIRNPTYFSEMFSSIFQDLNEKGDNDFRWLTWVIVPLVEALEDRFNPIGMGASGKG